MKVHIDVESFSEYDLKRGGVYPYAEHPSTEILVLCYAFVDEPVQTYVPGRDGELPARLRQHVQSGGIVSAFNAEFERTVLNGVAGEKIGFPKISIAQCRCSMAKVRVHGLPGGLGDAAEALGTSAKSATGRGVMLQLSRPRTGKVARYTPENSPEKFEELYQYCAQDVEAERGVDHAVPDLTARELEIWRLDQKINGRGIRVDQPAIRDIMYLIDQYKEKLVAWCQKTTGLAPSQTGKLAEWLRTTGGYPKLLNLQAPTVVECLEDEKCPPLARKVLRCYSIYAGKAVTKFDAMLNAVCADGRLRGMFMFYGAGPGRWSSRIINMQNFLRSLMKWDQVDLAIAACKLRSLDYVQALFDEMDCMKVFASCSRGMLIPAEGHDFIDCDFSQIESRIQAWLAGAEWKLEIFRTTGKIYEASGALMFGVRPEDVVDSGASQMRTAAKIGELACGYQGWVDAIVKMARQMGMKLTMDPAEIASRWREANGLQVKLWGYLEDAAVAAVRNPGKAYAIPNRKIMFKVEGRWLYMRLPSGRRIAYLDPEIHGDVRVVDPDKKPEPGDEEEGDGTYKVREGAVTYMGVDTYTRRWMRVNTYGGKLLQNASEGIGRDLLVNGVQHMEAAGCPTVMTHHDAGTFEVPKGFGDLEEAKRLIATPCSWAEGLPVKASGWRAKRYRK